MSGRATIAILAVGASACGRLGFDPAGGNGGGDGGGGDGGGGDGGGGDSGGGDGGGGDSGGGDGGGGASELVEGLGRGEGYAALIDPAGNSYVAGYFDGTTSFGGETPYTSQGGFDGYIAAYGPDDRLRWVTVLGGPGKEIVLSLAAGEGGDICATGWYDTATSFGGAVLPSAGDEDIFVACFDATGVHRWSAGTSGVGWRSTSAARPRRSAAWRSRRRASPTGSSPASTPAAASAGCRS